MNDPTRRSPAPVELLLRTNPEPSPVVAVGADSHHVFVVGQSDTGTLRER
ncbi:hypothetical protein I5Q34_15350 [Streptomyces sp. AV19]|nr:hypothetical protein [Streptomyces sp. AV19]MBH1935628.1 hypothetical protein [Streptomyces sp. AV19]MDG4534517.1 hypothetical protein [Streptomyces sp. AV19]